MDILDESQKEELVIYNNDFNQISISALKSLEANVFLTLMALMKDKKTDRIQISFTKLRKMANINNSISNKAFKDEIIVPALSKIQSQTLSIKKGNTCLMFNIFPEIFYDMNIGAVSIAVSDKFEYILNEFNEYTSFDLQEFVSLSSKYSKNMFRRFMQWKYEGKYYITVESIYDDLSIPKKVAVKEIHRRYISQIIKELKNTETFKDIECEIIKGSTKGKPTVGYLFTWTPPKKSNNKITASESEDIVLLDHPDDSIKLKQSEFITMASIGLHHDISDKDLIAIGEKCNYNVEQFRKAYKLATENGSTRNIVAFIKAAIDGDYKEPVKVAKKNKFNNFTQREYDYEELEKQLVYRNTK